MASRLIAGDRALLEFAREAWSIDHPIICIWETQTNPDILMKESEPNFLAIDLVRFYNKEHFHSLFFPNGFVLSEYNLVVAGIKEDDSLGIVYVPHNGLLRGWIMGTNIKDITFNMDINF